MSDFYDKEISRLENNTKNIEQLKTRLNNPYLIDFLNERINSPREHEKKQELLRNFATLSKEEQRIYRDYIANLMQNDPNIIKDLDDDLEQLIGLLRSMDRIEIYASIQNAYKNEVNDTLDQKYQIEITGGQIEKKVFDIDGFKIENKTYNIVGGDVEYIGNNLYKINIYGLIQKGNDIRYKTTEKIIIKYNGGNTLQVIDTVTNRNMGIQNLDIQKRYKRGQNSKTTTLFLNTNQTKIKVGLNIFDKN